MVNNNSISGIAQSLVAIQKEIFAYTDRISVDIQYFVAPMRVLQESIAKTVAPVLEAQERYRQSIEPILNTFYSISDLIRPVLSDLSETLRPVLAMLHAQHQLFLVAADLGWPPVVGIGSIDEIDNIYEEYKAGGPEKVQARVESLIEKTYCEQMLSSMLGEWLDCPFLDHRKEVLSQAILAHNNGHYYLSTAIMLTQIEGIVVENSQHTGWLSGKKLAAYFKNLAPSESAYDTAVRTLLINVIWASWEYDSYSILGPDLNRPAILHGINTSYGTLHNSLKVIILFHNLYEIIGSEEYSV